MSTKENALRKQGGEDGTSTSNSTPPVEFKQAICHPVRRPDGFWVFFVPRCPFCGKPHRHQGGHGEFHQTPLFWVVPPCLKGDWRLSLAGYQLVTARGGDA